MKRIGLIIALLLWPFAASAQSPTRICIPTGVGNSCQVVGSTNPLPVTGSITSTASEASTAAAPSYVEGTSNPLSGDLSGNLRTVLGGAIPAGTNLIGKAGIDQTTPGLTNGVAIAPSSAAAVAIAPVNSAAAESSHVLKASAGNLYSLTTNIGATTGYLMLFDATSAPVDGAVAPVLCRFIVSNGTGGASSLAWNVPLRFATGITAVFSSTGCFTKTASATAAFSGQVQ